MRPVNQTPYRDPAPSRWRYKLHRLMLTPLFRAFLRIGLPVFVTVFIAGVWFSNDANRQMLVDQIASAKDAIESREEFSVKMMAVDGADDALVAEIRRVLPIKFPTSSFDLNLEADRETVAALGAVESATIRIRPGGVLQVDVVQRTPVAVWRASDGLRLVDMSGAIIGPLHARADRADLPLVVGDGAREALGEALEIYAAAAPLGDRMRGLVRMGERRWDIVLDREQRILLPDEHPVAALERVIAFDQAQEMLNRDIKVVDMRNMARPTIRLNEMAQAFFRAPVEASN
ncbi:cell division protein FtsQ/DivIB [Aestuariibius sp. HNIBRBA575]|uniref:cell division protein FtsQ/DivIB n=1 Tax=Aestuariibius sp. HNIBRBA575 TaxID=3233343 RepID=UPI0034A5C507